MADDDNDENTQIVVNNTKTITNIHLTDDNDNKTSQVFICVTQILQTS